jgi:hypothetical protein
LKTILPSGLKIPSDAKSKLLRFAEEEFAYYDGIYDLSPNEIMPVDVLSTYGVNSQIQSAFQVRRIHRGMSDKCQSSLEKIPMNLDIRDNDWQSDTIEKLIDQACSVPDVLVARATKVLHRKRRSLVPMLDSVVLAHYLDKRDLNRSQDKQHAASVGMKALKAFRSDLIDAADFVSETGDALDGAGYALSHLRILEILIWIEKEPNGVYRN